MAEGYNAGIIPESYRGTSSLEYGYVSESGQQIATPEQIQADPEGTYSAAVARTQYSGGGSRVYYSGGGEPQYTTISGGDYSQPQQSITEQIRQPESFVDRVISDTKNKDKPSSYT